MIGWISIILSIIAFIVSLHKDNNNNEHFWFMNGVLCLICAAICFKDIKTPTTYYNRSCATGIAVMLADGKTATSICP